MNNVALTPAEIDLTLQKLDLTPKNWGQGFNDPKFQSLNRALTVYAIRKYLPSGYCTNETRYYFPYLEDLKN